VDQHFGANGDEACGAGDKCGLPITVHQVIHLHKESCAFRKGSSTPVIHEIRKIPVDAGSGKVDPSEFPDIIGRTVVGMGKGAVDDSGISGGKDGFSAQILYDPGAVGSVKKEVALKLAAVEDSVTGHGLVVPHALDKHILLSQIPGGGKVLGPGIFL
jgi:hypothetical protein